MQTWLDNPSKVFDCRHTLILTGGRGVELTRHEETAYPMGHNATSLLHIAGDMLVWFSRTPALGSSVYEAEAQDAVARTTQTPEQSWLAQAKTAENKQMRLQVRTML